MEIFKFEGMREVRAMLVDGEPWFVASDVCKVLGYSHTSSALRNHVDDEDKGVSEQHTPGGLQKLTTINESGLYALIFGSKLPAAKAFKRWVTSEVLPTLRKTSKYDMYDPTNSTDLLRESERLLHGLSAKVKELTPKAKVRDAVYEKNDGYCRRDVYAVAKKELGLKISMVEFNRSLHAVGITVPQKVGFNIAPEYYHWSEDALYFNDRLGSDLPNNNPHFNEAGLHGIIDRVRKVLAG